MPSTVTATWPDLVAGKKAKASEVEAKFDWLEGTLWPMMSGTTADLTYDLGADGKSWRSAWLGSINPTTTASGIAMGTTTANASTCLDLSGMPKAMLMPLLTTTQRNALTAAEGMLIYNTTNSRLERYEGGQWLAMNNPYGTLAKIVHNTTGLSYTEALNVTGSGNIRQIILGHSGENASTVHYLYGVIDGVDIGTITTATKQVPYSVILSRQNETTSTIQLGPRVVTDMATTTAYIPEGINLSYKSSAIIYHRSGDAGSLTSTASVIYEAA